MCLTTRSSAAVFYFKPWFEMVPLDTRATWAGLFSIRSNAGRWVVDPNRRVRLDNTAEGGFSLALA